LVNCGVRINGPVSQLVESFEEVTDVALMLSLVLS
jgi:hypothetical protein